jgi:uncharacterized repeat protein (TIGR04138 family)
MRDPDHPLADVVRRDGRYALEAYEFIFDAIDYARHRLAAQRGGLRKVRHISPRELLEGVRDLALEQFGLLATEVFCRWGIQTTSDVGEIVWNLVQSGDIELAPGETRADFDDVFDLKEELARQFRIMSSCREGAA